MFLYTSQSIATSNFVILLAIANNTIKKACHLAGLFLCSFFASGATSHLSLAPTLNKKRGLMASRLVVFVPGKK